MARIAVYTFSNSEDNYGEVLQYYATQSYLQRRGHNVDLLRFKPSITLISKLKRIIKKVLPRKDNKLEGEALIFYEWHKWSEIYSKSHPRYFEKFRQQYFSIKEYPNDIDVISDYDVFVSGSDQIWGGVNPKAFLVFSPRNSKRISIASSTGGYEFSSEQLSEIHNYLSAYNFITVREKSGLEMCNKAGCPNATLLLDPVFLLDAEAYSRIAEPSVKGEPYLFLYLLGAEVDLDISKVMAFAQEKKLKLRYVASQGRHDDFEKEWASVSEWVSLIKNADYVITNSFHGASFSIIFQKQFLVLPIRGIMARMNTRIYSIMEQFGLSDRILENNELKLLDKKIDYVITKRIIHDNKNILDCLMDKEGL